MFKLLNDEVEPERLMALPIHPMISSSVLKILRTVSLKLPSARISRKEARSHSREGSLGMRSTP
jgi:hypothetical protein